MADGLLRALGSLCAQEGRGLEVLVPRRGLCPVASPCVAEIVLPRFARSRLLWDHWTVPKYANRQRHAVLYNIKLVLPERLRIPGFTTFHDLMYFPQPKKYDWREYRLGDSLYMRRMIRRTVLRATVIHCDSHHTAADATELFPGAPKDLFRVVHPGIDAKRWEPSEDQPADRRAWEDLSRQGVGEPYVFFAGGLSRRKNVVTLIRAFAKFHSRHPRHSLVITGGAKPVLTDSRLAGEIARLRPGSFVQLGVVEPHALRLLYQRADFFVFPSLYEGFGFPPLEAQAAHCPVICSNAASLPEVVGASALLFDPHSEDQLLNRMEQLTQPADRKRVIAEGIQNLQRFDWTKAARALLELADEVDARFMASPGDESEI